MTVPSKMTLEQRVFEDDDIEAALLLKVHAARSNDSNLKGRLAEFAQQKIEEIQAQIAEYRRSMTEESDLWKCLTEPPVTRLTRSALPPVSGGPPYDVY